MASTKNELALYNLSDEHYEQLLIMLDSFYIYQERDAVRGDMWRAFPPSDKIRELKERALRIAAAYELGGASDVIVEDAQDIINYATFLIRQIREGATG